MQRPAKRERRPASLRWECDAAGPLRGGQLLLDPDAPVSWEREMNEGHFDPFICVTLAQRGCIEGAVFWDVGAHIGYHSLCFAALASPGGRVVHDGYPRRGTHLRVALLHHRPARLTAQPPSGDVPIREDNYQD